jgi:benzodiazapine receptor
MKVVHNRCFIRLSALIALLSLLADSVPVQGFQPIAQTQASSRVDIHPQQSLMNLAAHPALANKKKRFISSCLAMSEAVENTLIDDSKTGVDVKTLGKYLIALGVQMGMITGVFTGLDKLASMTVKTVPFALNVVLFYVLALKSRVVSPLSNRRPLPKTKEIDGEQQRKMPTWTPPGFIFPIVWLLLIGPLRAVTSSMIYKASGSYTNKAILSLMLHLSIGDIWNTINNVERRYGTSVVFVSFVWSSAAFAAFQYSKVLPLAGKLLSLKLIWLSIASSLIIRTWQLNPDPKTGKKYPFLPQVGDEAETKIIWFAKEDDADD